MKKRIVCGVLLLAVLLTGCARQTTAPEIEIGFPPLIIPRYPPACRYVPDPETDWQRAYLELLADMREQNAYASEHPDEIDKKLIETYFTYHYNIYDIDKDGIPELILKHGTCEAGYYGDIYTFREGTTELLGQLSLGHTLLYSCPDEKSIVVSYGHMGSAWIYKVRIGTGTFDDAGPYLVDGVLEFSDHIFQEGDVRSSFEYTPVSDIVPGAKSLPLYRIDLDLPIMDYGKERTAAPAIDDTAVCEQLLDTIRNNGMVYGATVNGFGGDTGYCDFQRYLTMLNWGNGVTPTRYLFADLNQDGQRECVLDVGSCAVVLSLQDGTVYAYSGYWFPGGEDWTVYDDGVIYSYDTDMEWAYIDRLSFSKDNCYEYGADLSPDAKIIPWEELQ